MLSILLVSRDVSLFADIFLRLGLKKIGHEFKQDSVDLQIFFGEIVRGGRRWFEFVLTGGLWMESYLLF